MYLRSVSELLGRPTATAVLLRGAASGAVTTKHAAVTRIRTKQGLAVAAVVEKLTGISGHYFDLGKAALRASQNGFDDQVAALTLLVCRGREPGIASGSD